MPVDPDDKGARGEIELAKMLARIAGVSVRQQPGSGSVGTRMDVRDLRGDLRLSIGRMTFRCEVKRREKPPQVLERWLCGVEILAIRADHGDWRFYLPEAVFMELLGLAADSLVVQSPPGVRSIRRPAFSSFRR